MFHGGRKPCDECLADGRQETGVPEIIGHALDPFVTIKPCDWARLVDQLRPHPWSR